MLFNFGGNKEYIFIFSVYREESYYKAGRRYIVDTVYPLSLNSQYDIA